MDFMQKVKNAKAGNGRDTGLAALVIKNKAAYEQLSQENKIKCVRKWFKLYLSPFVWQVPTGFTF